MNIGVPSERLSRENRVGLTPAGARRLVLHGHDVLVEPGAGSFARFPDEDYRAAGARVLPDRGALFEQCELLLKVGPLAPAELPLVREGQTVLAFHHLAASDRGAVDALRRRGATLIGYEVIEDAAGDLPVLHAMSEIAGQLAVHVGGHYLETRAGGRGVLLGGATGVPPAHVVILGAGVVGGWAARIAAGNGAQVTLLDSSLTALRRFAGAPGQRVVTEMAGPLAVERAVAYADIVVGAVLERGARAPRVVTRDMVETMKPGSVIVDVSIDQGGCVETSRPTTLEDPVFVTSEVTHFAVPNLTSAVARTASQALTHASIPWVLALADSGVELALKDDAGLARGVYMYRGELTSEAVARVFGMGTQDLGELTGLRRGSA
jgi:alanine dehydrogenase